MKKFILIGAILLLTGCQNTENISKTDKVENQTSLSKSEVEENMQFKYRKNDTDRKVKLDNEIQYIEIKEINNKALVEKPSSGISNQQSIYYDSDNLLYLFYDAEVPSNETKMIVTHEKFNNDYLLDYKLINSKENEIDLNSKIENELVKNNNRLVKDVSVKNLKNKIEVIVNGKKEFVNSGETKKIEASSGNVKSTLIISNHKIDSGNIVYQEPSESMKIQKELEKTPEYKKDLKEIEKLFMNNEKVDKNDSIIH